MGHCYMNFLNYDSILVHILILLRVIHLLLILNMGQLFHDRNVWMDHCYKNFHCYETILVHIIHLIKHLLSIQNMGSLYHDRNDQQIHCHMNFHCYDSILVHMLIKETLMIIGDVFWHQLQRIRLLLILIQIAYLLKI